MTPPKFTHPRSWLMVFGPGAIVASLTIGSGELVFSSRGGALFGYSLLSTFLAVCVLKWALVFATARHLVLTGQHPLERWAALPGPRGWLPAVFLIFALLCFPIWIAFHAGTVGTLAASLTGTTEQLRGTAHTLWGVLILSGVMWLAFSGNYQRLERIQLGLVSIMLLTVSISLVLLQPDWGRLFTSFFALPPEAYPDWIDRYPEITRRSVWLELSTYVGVIGGSGYDYLAYVSFLRTKAWGQSDQAPISSEALQAVANDPKHPHRRWIRAPLIDCTLSFLVVLLFSAVFVACGAEVLHPRQAVPSGATLLTLQTQFVSHIGPWFGPVYLAGAFLAMLGTLYGTIEVAPTIVREGWRALSGRPLAHPEKTRRLALGVAGLGSLLVLLGLLAYQLRTDEARPGMLVAMLTPANLFTGVLACGLISWLALWTDRRFLPRSLRMPRRLQALLLIGGVLFIGLGIKGYAEYDWLTAVALFGGTVLGGLLTAKMVGAKRSSNRR